MPVTVGWIPLKKNTSIFLCEVQNTTIIYIRFGQQIHCFRFAMTNRGNMDWMEDATWNMEDATWNMEDATWNMEPRFHIYSTWGRRKVVVISFGIPISVRKLWRWQHVSRISSRIRDAFGQLAYSYYRILKRLFHVCLWSRFVNF